MDDIVWSIKPSNDSMQKIVARMREFATNVLEPKDIELEFDIDEQVYDIKLNMEARRDFFLVSHVPDSTPRRHGQAWTAVAIMLAMVSVISLDRYTGVSVFNAAVVAAALMGITRCLSAEQAQALARPYLTGSGTAMTPGDSSIATLTVRGTADAVKLSK